ncbi:MAG: hypothetical protein ACK4FR_06965 [Tabrizicola sp.]
MTKLADGIAVVARGWIAALLTRDASLGQVNSHFRLRAWGLMPPGLVLSDAVVSPGEALMRRAAAGVEAIAVTGAV